nr:hypothetical protein [Tanacetum cinerariifolium]
FQAQEEEIGRLKERVQVLEDKECVATKQSGEDAPIKGRSNNEGEADVERISNDSEEIARVLTSMDAATVLAGEIDVPTGSGFIPTAGPPAAVISTGSEVGPTASPIVTRRKGKEVMVESDTLKKKKLQEQIDAQSQQRRPMTKKQKREYYMAVIKRNLGWRFKDFKGMTFEEIEAKFGEVWKKIEDFIPIGSKEETERLKRKGLNLEKEQVKKQKSSEEAPKIETITKEVTEEKIKEMMQLVPVEDVYVQAHQVKHPIIDWKVHSEGESSHWQYKFSLPVKVVPTARRLEMPLPEVCTIIEVMMKKLPEKTIPLRDINSQLPLSIVITISPSVLPIEDPEDFLIMGNEDLNTIPEKELDEVIKSSVEDLVPIPSKSNDTSGSDNDCDLPACDDFSPINILKGKSMTFFNPLFDSNDDFTYSNDESLCDEDVLEDNVKIYSNPLFEFDDENL